MAKCKYHEICGIEDGNIEEGEPCVLHSDDPNKDSSSFYRALLKHRKDENRGDNFRCMVFPREDMDFRYEEFSKYADFREVVFNGRVFFEGATYTDGANFVRAEFREETIFNDATFGGDVTFNGAEFHKQAWFIGCEFQERAIFNGAIFYSENATANFTLTKFQKRVDFYETIFESDVSFLDVEFFERASFALTTFNGVVDFSACAFRNGVLFAGHSIQQKIFSETQEIVFRNVELEQHYSASFRNADLQKCKFLDTDVREIEFTSVRWPRKRRFLSVYDDLFYDDLHLEERISAEKRQVFLRHIELLPLLGMKPWRSPEQILRDIQQSKKVLHDLRRARPWGQLERLYRELKQNYEDRKDYGRGGEFHYREKEMRRKNPSTRNANKFLLTLYWLLSGYGERVLIPFIWLLVLFFGASLGYLFLGLCLGDTELPLSLKGWLHSVDFSLRVMFFLESDEFSPRQFAKYVEIIHRLLSPVFLGLLFLAIRQRVKR